MHSNDRLVEARVVRFAAERLAPAVHRRRIPLTISAWNVPGEPVPFAEASSQSYSLVAPGHAWGRPWGTVWFRLTGRIPGAWADDVATAPELVLDLGFNATTPGFQAEGTMYSAQGRVLKGVEPLNRSVPLDLLAVDGQPAPGPGEDIDVYLEASSNPDIAGDWSFAPTAAGDPATAGTEPVYRLGAMDLALLDLPVWELFQDVLALTGLLRELPAELPRRAEILRALERCVDVMDPDDISGTALAGREFLAGVLAQPAYATAHRIHAVGHAHIDSAWLWPVRETVRKVARTFSNVLALMEQNPDFVFAASSAQQYAWLKQYYPQLFDRVRAKVASGQFVPVGGMWVESDTNMPGGEALARQFVAGKRFFLEEFGIEPLDVWLPDSFGYSAALPQIVAAAGSRWFLTQKISWNETNVMPHHTFYWEGIDGSRVFTHFPPVDTYNSQLSASELALAQRQYREKGAANTSLVPFGFGDGGGGPTREMLAAAARTADLEGSPAVTLSSPRRFFETAEAEYPAAPVWSGELYLEFHRGTYTSQARTKAGNRRSEHLLREAELWAAAAAVRTGAAYPYEELDRVWHLVLLQQFHDILPGTSIAWVHREAERNYAVAAESLDRLIMRSLRTLAGRGDYALRANAGPYTLDGVPALGCRAAEASPSAGASSSAGVGVVRRGRELVLANELLELVIDHRGLFTSIVDKAAGRELLPPGDAGNLLQLFRDTPTQWDAWDIDAHYQRSVTELTEAQSVDVVAQDPGCVTVRVLRSFGASTVSQDISLTAGTAAVDLDMRIDWRERQKLLKLAFPLDIHAGRAASEIQFGHIFRPTHSNTSWDAARFETVAHRWVHVGEPGYGVSVANSATYGHDISRSARAGGGTTTTVRLSLLRAPLFPDPESDQGLHRFQVALRLGADIPAAIVEGYRLNLPVRDTPAAGVETVEPLLRVDNPAVVVEAVKLAEDRSGDVIVRLYEAHGSRAQAVIGLGFPVGSAVETDLLERVLDAPRARLDPSGLDGAGPGASGTCSSGVPASGELGLTLRPFQLVTLRLVPVRHDTEPVG